MRYLFAPGCALTIENPKSAEKIFRILNHHVQEMERLDICCRNHPDLAPGTAVINVCAGCDRRYREKYTDSATVSFWEIIDQDSFWKFPDYKRKPMSVHDPCPVRTEARVHNAVRSLLKKMNIKIVEAEKIKNKSICCGDSAWGRLPADRVKEKMKNRADQMPETDVVVYCISCIKSMHIGGKIPRHLVDLLFGDATRIGTYEPDAWHAELEAYIEDH